MRRLAIFIVVLAATIAACQTGADGPQNGEAASTGTRTPASVDRVVDGDTLVARLGDGRRVRVRLIGIDTPETRRPDFPVECGGPQASAAMRRLALRGEGPRARGRKIVLVGDPSQDAEDRFGRRLAYVDADDGAGGSRDIGLAIVKAGWAETFAYDGPFQRQPAYKSAQRAAKRRGAGIWGLCR